jgi:hypothetical protein
MESFSVKVSEIEGCTVYRLLLEALAEHERRLSESKSKCCEWLGCATESGNACSTMSIMGNH